MTPVSSETRTAQVDAAIAEYLEAIDERRGVDPEAFLARHAELRGDLEEFFDDYRALERLSPRSPAAGQHSATKGPGNLRGASLELPCRLGNFELLDEIARGGMGVVYKARQCNPERIVALKMILAGQLASPVDLDRFQAEAQAAAALDHPRIVPIFETGEWEGRHYYTMGYVAGESLAERLARGPLAAREAATIIRDAALAVHHAHQQGVVHRDLKPANMLLDPAWGVRVADFGLAKCQKDESGLTRTGQLLGTPSFMSPEQVSEEAGSVGPWSDIYSLGATLYALVSGRPPFHAANTVDILKQVLECDPVRLRQIDASIPRDLETIALKCLEKSADRRYSSAQALADDLKRFLADEPIVARRATAAERAWRWRRRNPLVALLAGTLATVLVGMAFVAPLVALRQAALRQQADRALAEQVAITERLVDSLQGHDDLHRGGIAFSEARFEDARRDFEQGAAIFQRISDENPHHEAHYRAYLADTHYYLMRIFGSQNKLPQVEDAAVKAGALYQALDDQSRLNNQQRWRMAIVLDGQALFRLRQGDRLGYQKLRQTLLERFHDAQDSATRYAVAWGCSLADGDPRALEPAIAHAEKVIETELDNPLYQSVLGILLYRSGRFQESVSQLTRSCDNYATRRAKGMNDSRVAFSYLYLGMAQARLGDFDAARHWKSIARNTIAEHTSDVFWNDRLTIELLQRELAELLARQP